MSAIDSQLAPLDAAHETLEVLVLWGDSVLHATYLQPGSAFQVGDARDPAPSDFVLELSDDGGRVVLAERAADGDARIRVPADARCEFLPQAGQDAGAAAPAAIETAPHAGRRSCTLPRGTQARIEYRGLTFLVSLERDVDATAMRQRRALNLKEHAYTLLSFAMHAGALGLFALLPPHSSVLALDRIKLDARFTPYLLSPVEIELPKLPDSGANGAESAAPDRTNAPAQQADDNPARRKRDRPGRSSRSTVDSSPDRDQLRAQIGQAGILGTLRSGALSLLDSSPYGPAGGREYGPDQLLNGGFGPGSLASLGAGAGPRINGGGYGTIGVGRLGTQGDGQRPGGGVGRFRDHRGIVPKLKVEKPQISGLLQKEAIRRAIQPHLNEVRYCYEQALQARPDLQGRVVARFIIGPTGEVKMAAATPSDATLTEVANCIAGKVRQWHFPSPPGGGLVSIQYPFALELAGR